MDIEEIANQQYIGNQLEAAPDDEVLAEPGQLGGRVFDVPLPGGGTKRMRLTRERWRALLQGGHAGAQDRGPQEDQRRKEAKRRERRNKHLGRRGH